MGLNLIILFFKKGSRIIYLTWTLHMVKSNLDVSREPENQSIKKRMITTLLIKKKKCTTTYVDAPIVN